MTTSFRVSPSMSPLIATRLVAADGMVVPLGHAVLAETVPGIAVVAPPVGSGVVETPVAGTGVVVVVALVVGTSALDVEVATDATDADADDATVSDALPSLLQAARVPKLTTATNLTSVPNERRPFI
ncbi:MAG: hypothetical protein ABI949_06905 [Ilumatobacteraceae bacterium]